MNELLTKNRWVFLTGVLAYIGAFNWVYHTWLNPTFEYWGFGLDDVSPMVMGLAWCLALLPALWMPLALRRPSYFLYWVLYVTVYIPSMFIPLYVGLRETSEILTLMFTLLTGFAITGATHWFPLLPLRRFRMPPGAFWSAAGGLAFILFIWIVAVFGGHFQLVSFSEIYETIRFSSRDVASGTGVDYAVMWLSRAFVPFFMAWALFRRKPVIFTILAMVQVLLYATGGLKSVLLTVMLIPCLYFLLKNRLEQMSNRLIWLTLLLFLGLNGANLLVEEMSTSHFMLSSILFMRTFGVTGLATAQYHDFFSEFPVTYFSHVKGINMLVEYPYEKSIGQEIGFFYNQNIDLNANAHLWCMDGLAGMGLTGVLLISVLCGLVFWVLDSAARGRHPLFSTIAICFAAINLSNVSLFTSMVSGGLLFSILLLYFMPVEEALADPEEAPDSITLTPGQATRLAGLRGLPGRPLPQPTTEQAS